MTYFSFNQNRDDEADDYEEPMVDLEDEEDLKEDKDGDEEEE